MCMSFWHIASMTCPASPYCWRNQLCLNLWPCFCLNSIQSQPNTILFIVKMVFGQMSLCQPLMHSLLISDHAQFCRWCKRQYCWAGCPNVRCLTGAVIWWPLSVGRPAPQGRQSCLTSTDVIQHPYRTSCLCEATAHRPELALWRHVLTWICGTWSPNMWAPVALELMASSDWCSSPAPYKGRYFLVILFILSTSWTTDWSWSACCMIAIR